MATDITTKLIQMVEGGSAQAKNLASRPAPLSTVRLTYCEPVKKSTILASKPPESGDVGL